MRLNDTARLEDVSGSSVPSSSFLSRLFAQISLPRGREMQKVARDEPRQASMQMSVHDIVSFNGALRLHLVEPLLADQYISLNPS